MALFPSLEIAARTALEFLERAITDPDRERACLVAIQNGRMKGIVTYGMVAGAENAGRLHALAHEDQRTAHALLDHALASLDALGARLVVAEIANTPQHAPVLESLRGYGFAEVGRIADYFAGGVDLLIMRLSS